MNKLKVGDRINYKFKSAIGKAVITDINYERGYCHAKDDKDGFEWFLEEHNILQILNKEIKIIQNKQTTVILWGNGDKTVVKCAPQDKYDKHLGIAVATLKYQLGNRDEDGRKAYELIVGNELLRAFENGEVVVFVRNQVEFDQLMKLLESKTRMLWNSGHRPTQYSQYVCNGYIYSYSKGHMGFAGENPTKYGKIVKVKDLFD